MSQLIAIELPLADRVLEEFSPPVRAYIIPDLAPHLPGTFAVHRHVMTNVCSRSYWTISNVETGAGATRWLATRLRADAISIAKYYLNSKTEADYVQAVRKQPQWMKQ